MSLKNIIDKDIKESMFQKNKNRLIALRAIKAAILLEEKSSSSNRTSCPGWQVSVEDKK